MFQSQYGGQRFGQGAFGLPKPQAHQIPLADQIFNQSVMQQYGSPISHGGLSPRVNGGGYNNHGFIPGSGDPSALGHALPSINSGPMSPNAMSPKTMYQLPQHE